ncbi:MAG TPA: phage holin family protein [Candidatus Nitrosopolaris sp.]|nr:phage holin family protein [Candidatus Nitrosopolaris sp.]
MKFLLRWLVSSLGLWIAEAILGSSRLSVGGSWKTVLAAGFFLALVNMFVKPFLVFLSIPAILVSLGLFMLVVNGFLILAASWLYHPLYVKDFGVAIIAGLIVGLVNFLVTRVLDDTIKPISRRSRA